MMKQWAHIVSGCLEEGGGGEGERGGGGGRVEGGEGEA